MPFGRQLRRPARRPLPRAAWQGLGALAAACLAAGCAGPAPAADYAAPPESGREGEKSRPYVFAWPDFPEPSVSLRGGTTTGAAVSLASRADPAWKALQASRGAAVERDQAAIRALAGDYRVQFDFLETVVFEGDRPATPYRSWGTERVYVVRDEPGFLSLQHIMVMYVVDEAGETQGPFVQKHWRQDWTYEPERIFVYDGHGQWSWEPLPASEARGRWSQAVYQVDDTPRYSLLGAWSHRPGQSVWTSGQRWRPLPRREHTVRDDYDVLEGSNRVTIHPTGWTHEQDNLKLALAKAGRPARGERPVARELGMARYDRLDGFDFSAGDVYWKRTQGYWQIVRAAWEDRLADASALQIETACDGEPLFVSMFGLAAAVEQGKVASEATLRGDVDRRIDCVVASVGP